GLALVAGIVANNWVEVTRGPLCITGIPKPVLGLPGGPMVAITTLPGYYWLALAALAAVALLYRRLTTFRLGRAFHAVRDNEPLAGAAGIDPLRYRMLAFTIGAALAGGVGALYVHYLSVMCPEEMTVALTVNLLVIVFLGGVGSLRGVLLGAVLFTALPEVLRLAPTWRLVIYGALLLLVVVRAPEGIESLLRRVRRLETEAVARARRMLDLVGLTARADAAAGSLSYGQRKLLAFAGALMPDPDLLLLDEPAAAVNPTMINQMKDHILGLHRQGKTVL